MFRRRTLLRIGGSVLLSLAVYFGWVIYNRYDTREEGERRSAEVIAHIQLTDPRWTYSQIEMDRGTLPDEENSTLLVPRFKAFLARKDLDTRRPAGNGLAVPRDDTRDIYDDVPPNQHLDVVSQAVLDRELGGNDAALAVALQFREMPRGLRRYNLSPDAIGTLLPDLQETRLVATLLRLDAERLCHDGRFGDALHRVVPMLNSARSIGDEPFLISVLVRIANGTLAVRTAERVLGLGQPKAGLATIHAMFSAEAENDGFRTGVRGERATLHELFTNLRTGRLPLATYLKMGGQSGTPTVEDQLAAWHYAARLPDDYATFLETVSQACEVVNLPEHRQRAGLAAITLPDKGAGAILTRLLLPSFSKIHDSTLRGRAQLRCAAVGLAVERFRIQAGRWPSSLAEIPKDVLPAIPLDPFNGQPLKFVKRADGVTIYSVGLDETDNDGIVRDGKTATAPGGDLGFRLYDPIHRGRVVSPDAVPVADDEPPVLPFPRQAGEPVGPPGLID